MITGKRIQYLAGICGEYNDIVYIENDCRAGILKFMYLFTFLNHSGLIIDFCNFALM